MVGTMVLMGANLGGCVVLCETASETVILGGEDGWSTWYGAEWVRKHLEVLMISMWLSVYN